MSILSRRSARSGSKAPATAWATFVHWLGSLTLVLALLLGSTGFLQAQQLLGPTFQFSGDPSMTAFSVDPFGHRFCVYNGAYLLALYDSSTGKLLNGILPGIKAPDSFFSMAFNPVTNTFYICIVHKSRLKLQIHKYSKLEEFVVK